MGDALIVAIKGPGGKYGRADAPNTGPWGHLGTGWRGIVWDGTAPTAEYLFEATHPDADWQLVHRETRGLFGADATRYSGSLLSQFYLKPTLERGFCEVVSIYEGLREGFLLGVIEYADGRFPSCAVAIEVQP